MGLEKMKTFRKLRCICSLALLLSLNVFCFGQTSDTDAYLRKFEKKWNEYLKALGNVEGSINCKRTRNGKPGEEFVNYIVCSYPMLAELIDIHGSLDKPIAARVTGKDYSFSLTRSKPEDEWIIEYVSADFPNRTPLPLSFPKHFADPPNHVVNPVGYTVFNILGVGLFGVDCDPNLPWMTSSEWIVVKDISPVEKDGVRYLSMSFEYKRPDFPESITRRTDISQHPELKKYTLTGDVLLTTDYFLIAEGTFHEEWLRSVHDMQVEITYDCDSYKVPLPQKRSIREFCKMFVDGENVEIAVEEDLEFKLKETNPKSKKRFTLSQFGLPEPELQEPEPDSVRYILAAIGLALIIAFAIRGYRKRRARA